MDKLIIKLKDLNIKLKLVNEKLKINAPKGVVTREIIDEIKANKEDLIKVINSYAVKESFYKIPKAVEKDYYELSLAQKRIYFTYLLDPETTAYNMPQFYKIKGKLDPQKLEEALKKIMERHESLRTAFSIIGDEPVQRILPNADLKMDYYSCEESEVEAREIAFIRSFDLSKGCLLRAGLLKVASEEYHLLIDIHHIVNDGESYNLILRDIMRLYDGEILEEVEVRYRDYSEWQNSSKFQERLEKQKKFWKTKFAGFPGLLDLTLDYKQAWGSGPDLGESLVVSIDKESTEGLKSIAEKEGTTLFILVLALLNILFAKLTNQEDITIGSPVAGRHHPDLKEIVGMFVNSLPLRNYPQNDRSFKAFLATVATSVVESFDNQDFHYEQLINELNLERVGDRNPLFNILYTYINSEEQVGEEREAEVEIKAYDFDDTHAKFDFSITAIESDGQLYTNFHYNTKIFSPDLLERIAAYYKKIIKAVIADTEVEIGKIDILSERERKQLIYDFNDTKVLYPRDKTIVDLLNEQFAKTPDNIAIVVNEKKYTYREIHNRANQLAHYLIENHDLERGEKVALYTSRSVSMIISLLALLKAGATYIALDSKMTISRINKMIEDSDLKLIVTDQYNELDGLSPNVTRVDLIGEKEKISQASDSKPSVRLEGSDPAYIIYTSGSTGQPKGIIIEHAALLDYTLTFQKYFSVNAEDKVIQQASLAFDLAVEEIFPALISGAALMIVPQGGLDINYIIDCIRYKGATILSTTPLVLNELNKQAEVLKNLRVVISGGDLLLPAHIDEILKNKTVYNTYGPSESTVCITYNKIEKSEDISLLGKPIANRQVYITNKQNDLCPVLVPGELCVSGKGLARGYLNNEKLTEEKFIENPFVSGQRMYKTGDLARWLPDGNIAFLGRIDSQVKIRGVRIELGEIENLLISHDLIQEVVVTTGEREGDKYLIAYYVAKTKIETKLLMDFLSERLPIYMVPTYYVYLEKLPLTSGGKPDRKQLPELEIKVGSDYIAPTTEIEEKLVAIWAEILNLSKDKISVNRSFFELGGHSLKAINLISKMEKEFNVKIKLRVIFTKPTIRDLEKNILMNSLTKKTPKVRHNKIII